MRILAAVIREPGLRPGQLAARAGVSESTLFRDLGMLRRQGYPVTFSDGYQLQESLGLDGPNPALSLGAVYEHQLDLLKDQLPATLRTRCRRSLRPRRRPRSPRSWPRSSRGSFSGGSSTPAAADAGPKGATLPLPRHTVLRDLYSEA